MKTIQAEECKCGHSWLRHKWYRGPNMYCLVEKCACQEFKAKIKTRGVKT